MPRWLPTTARSSRPFATLVDAVKRSIPEGTQTAELKDEGWRRVRELQPGTKHAEE
jgi:hypothetical protein